MVQLSVTPPDHPGGCVVAKAMNSGERVELARLLPYLYIQDDVTYSELSGSTRSRQHPPE
ncbi:hypothetical protein [Pseudomonas sp. DWP3-1-2]|uniref:hypothetical protein n=1 Tax=Pseudomonas sp. DWP3-1-2 TaxID=2804645 RepID=UPI003CF598BD